MKRTYSAIDDWHFGSSTANSVSEPNKSESQTWLAKVLGQALPLQYGRAFLCTYGWETDDVPEIVERILNEAAAMTEKALDLSRCVTIAFKGLRDAAGHDDCMEAFIPIPLVPNI